MGHLGHEALHFFTHADKGIFSLVGHLLRRPGKVAREYIEGARKRYFPPLNFFLIVAALLVFSMSTFQRQFVDQRTASMQQMIDKTSDPVLKARLTVIKGRAEQTTSFMGKYANFVAFLATPLITLLFWGLYRRAGFNYTEHLVSNMYFSGLTNLFLSLVIFPINWAINSQPAYYGLMSLFFFLEIAFRARGYAQLTEGRPGGGLLKAVFTSALAVICWISLSMFIVVSYIRSGLWGIFN
jgi:hypothetical protein